MSEVTRGIAVKCCVESRTALSQERFLLYSAAADFSDRYAKARWAGVGYKRERRLPSVSTFVNKNLVDMEDMLQRVVAVQAKKQDCGVITLILRVLHSLPMLRDS